jgi:hypothetical protein
MMPLMELNSRALSCGIIQDCGHNLNSMKATAWYLIFFFRLDIMLKCRITFAAQSVELI